MRNTVFEQSVAARLRVAIYVLRSDCELESVCDRGHFFDMSLTSAGCLLGGSVQKEPLLSNR
jgi:hypothetical protein